VSDGALTGNAPPGSTTSRVSVSRPAPVSRLPVWPLSLMFGLTPLWWVLGGFYLFWPVGGALLVAVLIRRGGVELPRVVGWWLAFLGLAVLSLFRLPIGGAWATPLLRLSFYLTALAVLGYVYLALREGTPWRQVFRPLMWFWLSLVALGWLGVLRPGFHMVTPVEVVLPNGVASNPFIQDLVHMFATEFSQVSNTPTRRPSAPFPYTNNWGSTFALLLPCVIAYLMSVRDGLLRKVLLVSLPLSLPPAFFTLNRGMFVSLGVVMLYVGMRALARGNPRLVASVVGLLLAVGVAWLVIPVDEMIAERVSESNTTTDRLGLYLETIQRVKESPLLGYGAPAAADTTSAAAPVGTQGQVWLVMFSHGIPALLCFLAFFVVAMRRCARAVTPTGEWLATVPLATLVQLPFYGVTFHNLSVAFFALGLALAAVDGPVNRPVLFRRRPIGAAR